MKKIKMIRSVLVVTTFMVFASCANNKKQYRGPIVLGDSSTIVTEQDPKYLTNYVDDIKVIPQQHEDTTPVATAEAPVTNATTATAPNDNGLNIPFKLVNVFFPNIQARSFQKIDFDKANGASYQLADGKLNGNILKILSGNITKVSMRYKTAIVASNNLGTLELVGLAKLTDWQAMNGSNGSYPITGLDDKNLKHNNANNRQIRNYVNHAARNKRMSRVMISKWENSFSKVKSVNQSPLSVKLSSVMFKIEGKDENGKYFQKQIRIDIPVSN